jgi:type IV pilus assembly protein PilB
MTTHGFIGQLLIRAGVIDAAGLARALDARPNPDTLGHTLAALGLADESVVSATIASALHLEYLEGELPEIDNDIVALVPADFCRKRRVVPLGYQGNFLRLAVTDPMDESVVQDVRFLTGKKTVAVVVTQSWLDRLCSRVYPEKTNPYDMLDDTSPAGEVESTNDEEYDLVDPATLAKDTKLPPIVRLVNRILSEAAAAGASDIHIEPQEASVQVRHRVDGLLHDVLTIPPHLRDQTISRFKIICGMDISERRKPQDGRSRLRFQGRRIDLRISTLPTQFGEKIVIRLLNSERAILPLDQIGLSPENLRLTRSFLTHQQGMILVTGPTGSGKTSTLYTALNTIKSPTNNIVTLEDPIEIQLPGVNQMQINPKAGVTFAGGLRSILRQDPNVILVGEIRDQETAAIALQASQTGHLLLSTLHTNDAPSTVTRLFDLGVPPFLVASSILGIIAQRLVGRPCPSCAVPEHPSAETIERVRRTSRLPDDGRWVVGKGCPACQQTGIKGRIAIHEVLEINDGMRELISSRASEPAIRNAAKKAGMRTLYEDGLEKAAQGLTTLEEVLRVVSPDERSASEKRQTAVPAGTTSSGDSQADGAAARTVGGGRVLVVEDSRTVAAVIKYFLELEGFEVLQATDGLVGLEMAKRECPDLIVSDINMPEMNGTDMVKAIRLDPRLAHVPVLMLTSEASVECETEGLAAGADDYILKPVEPRRLVARVKALFSRHYRAA